MNDVFSVRVLLEEHRTQICQRTSIDLLRRGGKRRDGATLIPWVNEKSVAWDVTVPGTFLGCWPAAVEQFTSWLRLASSRRRDRTVQTASGDVSVCARLRRIATFLFIGALEAYLLTFLLTFAESHYWAGKQLSKLNRVLQPSRRQKTRPQSIRNFRRPIHLLSGRHWDSRLMESASQ